MNKKSAETVHFSTRLKQRYNIDATPQLIKILIRLIKSDMSKISERITNRCTLHIIKINNKGSDIYLPLVYDKERHNLVTCLPQTDNKFIKLMKEYKGE